MSRTVLVAGTTATVGLGIAKVLLDNSFRVVTFCRNAESIKKVKENLGNPSEDKFIAVEGYLSSIDEAMKLKDDIVGKIGDSLTDVVSCMGRMCQMGPVLDQTVEEFRKITYGGVEPHFLLAKMFLPSISDKQGSTYTIITGGGAHNYFPNLGLLSILGGAMANLCLVLQAEHKDKPVRINNFCIAEFIQPVIGKDANGDPNGTTNVDIGLAIHCVITHTAANGVEILLTKESLPKVIKTGIDK